ncbi:arabinose transporter, partial [Salmonella enterica subsp. enterica serovar Weltevreden]|nr:arabinose transporter [Salmonella enterica subsp. enterica serovar Weltevreden]
GSTHAGQVISWNGRATYGALALGAPLGLSRYARAGLALPALLVVLVPIIASGVINGSPGKIPTARPRVPVLRVVGLG